MPNLVEVVVRVRNDTAAGLRSVENTSTSMATKLQKVGMIGAGALAAVAVGSVVMASKFDASMTTLQTQAGVSQSKLKVLQAGVLDLAGQVGFSPQSLAESAYHVASNMQSMGATSQQMLKIVKTAAEGAAVGHADLVDETNALTAAIASGIPGVKNYQQAMGALNATVGTGDMTMQNLADALGTGVLAVVKQFGLSITDAGAALAVFGDNNIRGARAGTQLRMAVQALAAPTKKGIDLLNGMGMTSDQLAKDMQSGGLLKAITDLKTHMDKAGISAKEQGQIITETFGKRAGVGVSILIGQYARLQSKYPDLAKGADQFGNAWKRTQETTSQKFKQLEGSFEAVAIKIGNRLMPAVITMLNWTNSHINVVTKFAAAIAGVAVVLGTYAVAAKIAAVAQALLNTSMDVNPFILLTMAVIAITLVIIKYHTQIWNFIYKTWSDIRKFLVSTGRGIESDAIYTWEAIWNHTIGAVIRINQGVIRWTYSMQHSIANIFDGIRHDISSIWDITWNNTQGRLERGIDDMLRWFRSLPGWVMSALRGLASDLYSVGQRAINNLWDGAKSKVSGITGFFSSFAKGIVGIFKKIWGWFSPSAVMYEGGKSLMDGLAKGIHDHAHKAQSMAAGVANKVANVGSGVARWKSTVIQALKMEGLPTDLAANVLYQMQTESGGNPNAINLTDSNAAAGDPSRGLMQTIMSTFRAYHWPGTSWNIYDPLANVAAAINYAKHVYGPNLANQYGGIGSGHGYASGGPSSGGWAMVGERGRELVRLPNGSRVFSHGTSEGMMGGGGAIEIIISIDPSMQQVLSPQQIRAIQFAVRRLGGGDVQKAFGRKLAHGGIS
jgi:TP901 family phage tail tape measure protein